MHEVTPNCCQNAYNTYYLLTDSSGNNYNLQVFFKNSVYQQEVEDAISNFNNSSSKEIGWISSKLESIVEKSDRAMTLILQKSSIFEAHQCIDEFLKLEDSQKELFSEKFGKKLVIALHAADLNRIVDESTGNTVFHQLLKSKSAKVRPLALECISAGFPVDAPNERGSTGLLLAVVEKDVSLIKQFLERGADHNKQCGKWTPKELAVCYDCHFITLEFFAHEIKLLKNDVDQIIDLWLRISYFRSRCKENENIDHILKICDDQILSLFNIFVSKIDNNFDLKKVFGRKCSLYHNFLEHCAYEGHCELLIKNLDNQDLLDLLSKLLKKGISRDFTEERDLKLLKSLFDSRLFFILTEQGLLSKHPIVEPLMASFDEKTLLNCAYSSQIIDPKTSFLTCLEEEEKIKLTLSQIIDKDPVQGNHFNRFLEPMLNEVDKHKKAFSQYHGNSLEFLEFINKNNLELNYLADSCLYFDHEELLSDIYDNKIFGGSIEKFKARIFFHFFLDKFMIPPKKSLEEFAVPCTSGVLIQAFDVLENNLSDYQNLSNIFKTVKSEITYFLKNARKPVDCQRILSMNVKDKLLIPLQVDGHFIALMVEKTDKRPFVQHCIMRVTGFSSGIRIG